MSRSSMPTDEPTQPAEGPAPEKGPEPGSGSWWMSGLLAMLAIVAFWPVLRNGFVGDWDDKTNFIANYAFRGLGLAQLRWAWNAMLLGVYQPVAWMLLSAESAIWGVDPRGYHLASLLLHALNMAVFYRLTLAVLARCPDQVSSPDGRGLVLGSALVVALFAVHPLRTEVVAWASCQPYLPCALFFMLSILAYLRAQPPGGPTREAWLNASVFLFLASILSKAVAVSLPAVLVILDIYPLRRLGGGRGRWLGPEARGVWLEKLRFAVPAAVFMAIAVEARERVGHMVRFPQHGIEARLVQSCYGLGFYVVKTLLPVDLSPYYPIPGRQGQAGTLALARPVFALAVLATVAVTVGLVLLRRRRPGLLAAFAAYAVILAPNLGLVRVGHQIAADRYSYVATLPLFIALAAGLARLTGGQARRPALGRSILAAGLIAVVVLSALSWRQCRVWQSAETLWAHALAHGAGDSNTAQFNMGVALAEAGKLDEAEPHLAEAVRLDPDDPEARMNLGSLYAETRRLDEAVHQFNQALRANPLYPEAHNNLGATLSLQGKTDQAIEHFQEALRLRPDYAEAHANLGAVLLGRHELSDAAAHYAEALRINPDLPAARAGMEAVFRAQGRPAGPR